jgi:hypothetical protein
LKLQFPLVFILFCFISFAVVLKYCFFLFLVELSNPIAQDTELMEDEEEEEEEDDNSDEDADISAKNSGSVSASATACVAFGAISENYPLAFVPFIEKAWETMIKLQENEEDSIREACFYSLPRIFSLLLT